MTSNLLLEVPKELTHNVVQHFIEKVRTKKPIAVLFDWTKCESSEDLAICLVLSLLDECAETRIKVRHAPLDIENHYQHHIKPILEAGLNQGKVITGSDHFWIAIPANNEGWDAIQASVQEFMASQPMLKGKSRETFTNAFLAAAKNVGHHASVSFGYGVIAVRAESGFAEFSVADLGVGIATNIRESFEGYDEQPDTATIVHALTDGITTESDSENTGKGFSVIKAGAVAPKSLCYIYSGEGFIGIDDQGVVQRAMATYHFGTQVMFRITMATPA